MSQELAFHAPKQARSRRTLDRILEAARELVAEQGADATSVQQIVDRAGSSVGSFYARFGGKDDLLDYLERRVWDEARERWDRALEERAWAELPLDELATGVVRVLLDVGRHERDVRRALQLRRGTGGETEPARAFRAHLRKGIRGLLLAHVSEMTHPDPPRAVDVGLRVLVGGLRELEAGPPLADEEVVAELGRLLLAYLGADGVARGEGGAPMDFFDVWG